VEALGGVIGGTTTGRTSNARATENMIRLVLSVNAITQTTNESHGLSFSLMRVQGTVRVADSRSPDTIQEITAINFTGRLDEIQFTVFVFRADLAVSRLYNSI
jgi:hypothetical protein